VAFYVPLGPRGILFRIGTLLIGVFGGWVYWRASRRRPVIAAPVPLAFDLPEPDLLP
jgi:hypothetical protein